MAADGPGPGGGGGGPDSPVRGRLPAGAGRPGLAVLGPKPDGAGTVRPPLPGDLVWAPGTGGAPPGPGALAGDRPGVWPAARLWWGWRSSFSCSSFSCGIMTESASGRDRLWWRSTGESTGGAISAPGSADMKAGSSGGRSWGPGGDGDGHCELAQLFYRLRPGGGPGGAVPDGAGGLPVSESPRAEAAGHPGRGAGLCAGPPVWGRCPAGRTGALLAGVGPDRPVSDRGRAGGPPAGRDHPGPGRSAWGKTG